MAGVKEYIELIGVLGTKYRARVKPDGSQMSYLENLIQVQHLLTTAGEKSNDVLVAAMCQDFIMDHYDEFCILETRHTPKMRQIAQELVGLQAYGGDTKLEHLKFALPEVQLIIMAEELAYLCNVPKNPRNEWQAAMMADRVVDGKKVADVCRGVNGKLTKRYDEVYAAFLNLRGNTQEEPANVVRYLRPRRAVRAD